MNVNIQHCRTNKLYWQVNLMFVSIYHQQLICTCDECQGNANLIDVVDVSSLGLGRRPDMRTKNSYDQFSKLINVTN